MTRNPDNQVREALGPIHGRCLQLIGTSAAGTQVMLALINDKNRLGVGFARKWVRNQHTWGGMYDERSVLRRRYAQALRDPSTSPWGTALCGIVRCSHEQHGVTTEIIEQGGAYATITSTADDSAASPQHIGVGQWNQMPVRARIGRTLLHGLEDTPVSSQAITTFARGLDIDVREDVTTRGGLDELARRVVGHSMVRGVNERERTQGSVYGLDIASYTILDELVWGAFDLDDLLVGQWTPWT